MSQDNKTHFGFKTVAKDQKSNMVKKIFSNVANKYDLMNDLMSLSIHRIWKNEMIKEVYFCKQDKLTNKKTNNYQIIDVAGGTGDIAFRIAKKSIKEHINSDIKIVDINQEMLEVGKERNINNHGFNNLEFILGDGENLNFSSNNFNFYTIAFGIRNFTNIDNGLKEANRVLKKGGKFICLEFSKVNDYFLQKLYDCYSFKIIPKIGELVLKDRDSYQYLVESIRRFPNQDDFAQMIKEAGFVDVSYKNLSFGAATIHIGYKS
jgi:ubiquinone/menaquinone biosynthesis methyltransferase